MRQKRRILRRTKPRGSVPYDPGASARQLGLIETGSGAMYGPLALLAALLGALTLAGLRAWWRANTRRPDDPD